MTNLAARPEHGAQLQKMLARLAELRSEFDDIDSPRDVPFAPDPGRCPT